MSGNSNRTSDLRDANHDSGESLMESSAGGETQKRGADFSNNPSPVTANNLKKFRAAIQGTTIEEAFSFINALSERLDELCSENSAKSATIDSLRNTVASLQKENERLKSRVKSLEERGVNHTQVSTPSWADIVKGTTPSDEQIKVLSMVAAENAAIESKERKIVILGLKEVPNISDAEAAETDNRIVSEIFNAIGKPEIRPTFMKRLRARDEKYPRPLLVELPSREDRIPVLAASKTLHRNGTFENVYINPDLTVAERRLDAKLREERNEKNKEIDLNYSEFRYGIRRKRVVKVRNTQY